MEGITAAPAQADATPIDETSAFEVTSSDAPVQANAPEPEGDKASDTAQGNESEGETVNNESGDDSAADAKKDEKPNRVQKRIDKVVREREDAKRKAERLEAKIRELESKVQSKDALSSDSPQEPAPVEDDFETYDEYLDAVSEHEDKVAASQKAKPPEKNSVDETPNDAPELSDSEKTAIAIFHEKVAAAENLPDDFKDVISSKDLDISGPMMEALAETQAPDVVAYHLAKNPDLATQIAQKTPAQQGAAIAELNRELAKPPKPVSLPKASDPIDPVGSNYSEVSKDPSEMSFEEYEKHQNKLDQRGSSW